MADINGKIRLLRGTLASFAAGAFTRCLRIITDSANGETLATWNGIEWLQMARQLTDGSLKSQGLKVNGVNCIDSSRGASFSSLKNEAISSGTIPVQTAGGEANSSLSEDATSVNSAKPLTLNGATRLAWGPQFAKTVQTGPATALGVLDTGTADSQEIWVNCYYNGSAYKAINSRANNFPARLSVSSGSANLYVSKTQPTAGGTVSDMAQAWGVDQYGQSRHFNSELITSGRYIKATDTTIGPSAAAKASLLNGGTSGFTAVTDPTNRWNAVGAASETVLKGNVTTVTNQILTFELYRNGANAVTLSVPARSYGTGTPWRLVIDQVVRVAGTTGTVRVKMRFYITADNANAGVSCYDVSATLTGVDLTAAHTWDVVCTIPNNAGNSITCDYAKKAG